MSTIVAGTNAVSFFIGLNWDRFMFVGAVVAALLAAAALISFETAQPTLI